MKTTLTILLVFVFGVILMFARHTEIFPLITQIGFIFSIFLTIRYRHLIADWFLRFPIKNHLALYLIAAIPFLLYEENINCLPPDAGGCKLFPITLPFLLIELLLLLFFVRKFNLKNFWLIITVFSVLGVLWEITVGAAAAAFMALPPIWFVIIFIRTWFSYAILAIVPLTVELKNRNQAGGGS